MKITTKTTVFMKIKKKTLSANLILIYIFFIVYSNLKPSIADVLEARYPGKSGDKIPVISAVPTVNNIAFTVKTISIFINDCVKI